MSLKVVLYDYVAQEDDELSIYQGETVSVIETYDDGWWMVANDIDRGLVPSNYLSEEHPRKISHENDHSHAKSKGKVDKERDLSDLRASNDLSPDELKRLKGMREQAEMRISALRTAVSNYESETLTKKAVPSDKTHQQYKQNSKHNIHHQESAPVDDVPAVSSHSAIRQPEKSKPTKKAHSSRASENLTPRSPARGHTNSVPTSNNNSNNSHMSAPPPHKIPQVALDQNSLNFISKIINERLEKEFSVRDERIIDKVKSLLGKEGSGEQDEAMRRSSHQTQHSDSAIESSSSSYKDGRLMTKIPRVNFPKVQGAAPAISPMKNSQQQQQQPPVKVSTSAPSSSSAVDSGINSNKLPRLVNKAQDDSSDQHQQQQQPHKRDNRAKQPQPQGDIHDVREKRPPAMNIKPSVVDEVSQGIRYPQCRSVVYPPTDIDRALRNATDTPPAELVLQHIYGHNGNPQNGRTKLCVLGDNRVVFAAASIMVCMDPITRKQSFFTEHTGEISSFAMHPNKQFMVSSGPVNKDTAILLWDTKLAVDHKLPKSNEFRGGVIRDYRVPRGVRSVIGMSISGDGCYLSVLAMDESHSLLIYDVSSAALVATAKLGLIHPWEVLFNPYAQSTVLSTEMDDATIGCYTLVAYGGKQIKFWSFSVYVGTSSNSSPKKGGSRGNSSQQQSSLQYSLEGTMGSTTAAATPPADITCIAFADDSTEIHDREDDVYYRRPHSRVLAGTSTGSVVIWQQASRDGSYNSASPQHDEEGEQYEPEHFSWLPKGKIVSVVTDVHDSPITDVSYFTSGHAPSKNQYRLYERLLTSGSDGSLNLWGFNRSDDKSILPLEHVNGFELESKDTVTCIAWDALGDCVTVGTTSHSIINVCITNDEDVGITGVSVVTEDALTCHAGKLKRIAVNPVLPSLFATICSDKTVRIWESTAIRQVGMLTVPYNATSVSFSSDGKSLAVGNDQGELYIYASTEFAALMGQNKKKIHSMLGATIIALSLNNWTVAFKRHVTMQSSVISPHKSNNKKVSPSAAASNKQHCDVMEIKYSPSGNTVAVGCKDNLIHLLSVKTGYKHTAVCRGHSSFIKNIDFSVSGDVMQSVDAAREILFWDGATGQQLLSAEDFRDVEWSTWSCVYGWPVLGVFNDGEGRNVVDSDVHCVCRSQDATLLVAGNSHQQHGKADALKLFSYPCVDTAVPLLYGGHTSSVSDVAFLSGLKPQDVKVVSVGGSDGCIFQWQVVAAGRR